MPELACDLKELARDEAVDDIVAMETADGSYAVYIHRSGEVSACQRSYSHDEICETLCSSGKAVVVDHPNGPLVAEVGPAKGSPKGLPTPDEIQTFLYAHHALVHTLYLRGFSPRAHIGAGKTLGRARRGC